MVRKAYNFAVFSIIGFRVELIIGVLAALHLYERLQTSLTDVKGTLVSNSAKSKELLKASADMIFETGDRTQKGGLVKLLYRSLKRL